MTILDDIGASIQDSWQQGGASVVGVGQRWGAGSGIVLGEGQVLHQRDNVRGDRVTSPSRRAHAEGTWLGTHRRRPGVIGVDTSGAPHCVGRCGFREIGTPVFAAGQPGRARAAVTFGRLRRRATFRAARAPTRITGSLEHTAPLLPAPRAARFSPLRGQLLGINTNRLARASTLPYPRRGTTGPGRCPRQGESAQCQARRCHSRLTSARRLAAPSGCPRPMACSSATRRQPAARAVSPRRPDRGGGGVSRRTPTTCSTHSKPQDAAQRLTCRGTDERTFRSPSGDHAQPANAER